MPMAEIYGGISAFKTMLDMAKSLKDMGDASARNAAVIELQEKILAAREAQSTLLERVSDLEKQVAGFERWEAEKQRYELKQLTPGSYAFVLKPEAQGTEPPHKVCASCFQHRKISILQLMPESSLAKMHFQMQDKLRCPECKSEIVAG